MMFVHSRGATHLISILTRNKKRIGLEREENEKTRRIKRLLNGDERSRESQEDV